MFYKNIKQQAEQFLTSCKKESPATFAAAQQAIGGLLIVDGLVGIGSPFHKKGRSGIFGALIGIALGFLLVFGTGFFVDLFGIHDLTATTTATIESVRQPSGERGSGACTPRALYIVGGKEYVQTASSGSSSACALTPGQVIEINYNPQNPGAWAYDLQTAKTFLKIFPVVGVIIIFMSFVTFIIRLFSILFGWKLLRSGQLLAKTLPTGTNLALIKQEMKKRFFEEIGQ